MRHVYLLIGGLLILVLITSCGSSVTQPSPEEIPTTLPNPTDTSAPPTSTLVPTEIPSPTTTIAPTTLPEGVLFRDDFSGSLQPGWTWENEKPDRWKITDDGWLQIHGEDPSALGGEAQSNMLFRALPAGDFMITVHVTAATNSNFQQAAIFLYEDVNNYVAINRGFCEPCFPGNGNGIFMDYKIGGNFIWTGDNKVESNPVDVYLRLVSKEKIIYGYYAFEPGDWKLLNRLGDFFEFKRVGLGVTNSDRNGVDSDLVGSYDYFEIAQP